MRTLMRLQLAVLFLIATALLAGTPALAALGGTVQLTDVGDETGATGTATLTKATAWRRVFWDPMATVNWESFKGYRTVTCTGLTPNATYWTPARTLKADRSGKVTVRGWVQFGFTYYSDGDGGWIGPDPAAFEVDVLRRNPDGSSTLVLTGEFPRY